MEALRSWVKTNRTSFGILRTKNFSYIEILSISPCTQAAYAALMFSGVVMNVYEYIFQVEESDSDKKGVIVH